MEIPESLGICDEVYLNGHEETEEPSQDEFNQSNNMLSQSLDKTMRDLLEATITNINAGSIINTLINSKNMLTQSLRNPDQASFYVNESQYPHRTIQTMISESPSLVVGILLFIAFFFISMAYYVIRFIYICWKYIYLFLNIYLHSSLLSTANGLYFILLSTQFTLPMSVQSKVNELKRYLFKPYKINSEAISGVQFENMFYKILYIAICALKTGVLNVKFQFEIIILCLQLGSIKQSGRISQIAFTIFPIIFTTVYFIKPIKNSIVMDYARYAVAIFLLGNNYFTMLYNQLKILFTEQKRCHAQEE